jgi:hypothetical protein
MLAGNGTMVRKLFLGVCVAGATFGTVARADDKSTAELRALIEKQGREIQELKQKLEAGNAPAADGDGAAAKGDPAPAKKEAKADPKLDDAAVKKIVGDYLKANPGAGMPPSVQTGYELGRGFAIRSTQDPSYVKWDDDCKIPFELRFRGRLQLDYYKYKVTDRTDHRTGIYVGQNANSPFGQADFSQLEIKRLRLVWEGTAFDPNLFYHFELDGNTRGLGGFQNNKVVQTADTTTPQTTAVSPIGGGVTVDHAVRLFSAYVAYSVHGCAAEKGCAPDCPDCFPKYAPTYTFVAGKLKPFFGLEEYLGSANEQMVEYSMADWYFDADDDNLLMGAGMQIRAFDDRFYCQWLITNGNESQFPNTQMDDYPGFCLGFWYDFGGSWNEQRKRWDLFGDCLSDIDYSCSPVCRCGASCNLVPMDRRSLYGDDEQSRVFVMPGAPQGGSRLINVLNGAGASSSPPAPGTTTSATVGSHAVDEFDSYSYNAFCAFKYRGFSLYNEWWLRDLNNFHAAVVDGDHILYTAILKGVNTTALFPNKALFDYGCTVQGGYFIVPKRIELCARCSYISGDSGDINGDGKIVRTTTIPGVLDASGKPIKVPIIQGAFSQYHQAYEYAFGVNYFFKRHLLKWQSDISFYEGGNPAGGGQSPAGFIAGSDGYLLRTQIQMAF